MNYNQRYYHHSHGWNEQYHEQHQHGYPLHYMETTAVAADEDSQQTMYYSYDQLASLMVSLSETTWRIQLWLFASILVMMIWLMLFMLMRATRKPRKDSGEETAGGKPKTVDGTVQPKMGKDAIVKESDGTEVPEKAKEGGNFGKNLMIAGEPDAPDSKYRLNDYWSIDIRDSVLKL
ncbi:uncharacterized protein LOC142340995 [Convolutriloba macropyga]|uniref:uncharacterized protein LOC142340995 n=1 Tax=Convolutriloba macropyga TaxID=536237 RepID=UPI003F527386